MIEQEVLRITNRLLSFGVIRIAQKTISSTIICCRDNVFTELLPSNDRGKHRHIDNTRTA
jgi:hypothetical protein